MALLDGPVPIESDEHVLRARRTAALTRIAMGMAGIVVILARPALEDHPALGVLGFATILATSLVQFAAPRLSLLSLEESLSGIAGLLIIGMGAQRVGILSLLWLVAVASGVLARGGRVHWVGRSIVVCSMALPIVRDGELELEYAAFCVATLTLLLTSGRLTSELNLLLRQARLQADSAETLLLAGDIAARMADRGGGPGGEKSEPEVVLSAEERASALAALGRLVQGEGLKMVVQPIVDIRTGAIHAFEALARFGDARPGSTPLHWFALAEALGGRAALERACLRETLKLLGRRPSGTSLTVNLSVAVLLEAETLAMLHEAAEGEPDELAGLVIEITEETLVRGESELQATIEPLRARGARLAVDDMGAGYSGLRQITTVLPSYLKLDRALVSGIDTDPDRAALVAALTGYSNQVGSMLIAEGVETTAELRILQQIGVPLVQGFRLSRPGEPWPEVDTADAGSQDAPRDSLAVVEPAGVIDPSDWYAIGPQLERTSSRGAGAPS
jgi:EAL domain-containing protein (putative c-di-GMP-specific phosphodiesterase class I)